MVPEDNCAGRVFGAVLWRVFGLHVQLAASEQACHLSFVKTARQRFGFNRMRARRSIDGTNRVSTQSSVSW
jgi:hypothetical protein